MPGGYFSSDDIIARLQEQFERPPPSSEYQPRSASLQPRTGADGAEDAPVHRPLTGSEGGFKLGLADVGNGGGGGGGPGAARYLWAVIDSEDLNPNVLAGLRSRCQSVLVCC